MGGLYSMCKEALKSSRSIENLKSTDCFDKSANASADTTTGSPIATAGVQGQGLCEDSQEMLLSSISELRGIVTLLISRIDEMERTVKDMKVKGKSNREDGPAKQVSDISNLSDTKRQTYADAVRNNLPKTEKIISKSQDEKVKPAVKSKQPMVPKKRADCSGTTHDVKIKKSDTITNDVINSQKKEKENTSDLPVTFIIHDSVLKGLEPERLGQAYGVHAEAEKAYVLDDLEKAVESLANKSNKSPDAILVHVGVNDLKKKDVKTASRDLKKGVHNIRQKHPKAKIILSNIAPTRNHNLERKRKLLNTTMSELSDKKNIFTAGHENLKSRYSYIQRDNIHPTTRGTSVLAGNVGRALRSLFWQLPRPRRRHTQWSRPYNRNINDDRRDKAFDKYRRNRHFDLRDYQHTWWNRYNILYNY